jgi:hypothetical protein
VLNGFEQGDGRRPATGLFVIVEERVRGVRSEHSVFTGLVSIANDQPNHWASEM